MMANCARIIDGITRLNTRSGKESTTPSLKELKEESELLQSSLRQLVPAASDQSNLMDNIPPGGKIDTGLQGVLQPCEDTLRDVVLEIDKVVGKGKNASMLAIKTFIMPLKSQRKALYFFLK